MGIKRHKPEEIVTKQTFYRWRKQYGGMGTDQLRELKRLQKENDGSVRGTLLEAGQGAR
jgi:putative transposase